MFFCDPCAKRQKWPVSFSKSNGQCEVCRKSAVCNSVPSNCLPERHKKKIS